MNKSRGGNVRSGSENIEQRTPAMLNSSNIKVCTHIFVMYWKQIFMNEIKYLLIWKYVFK